MQKQKQHVFTIDSIHIVAQIKDMRTMRSQNQRLKMRTEVYCRNLDLRIKSKKLMVNDTKKM